MYIVLDIGGTKTRIGVCEDLDQQVNIIKKLTTADKIEVGMKEVCKVIKNDVLSSEEEVEGMAIGIAGAVDKEKGVLLASPNLSGWTGKKIASFFTDITEKKNIYVANDTALGALGEATTGAGTPDGVTAYLTVGTGVGGSRIVNGQIDAGSYGFEPGHQVIDLSAWLDRGGDIPFEGHIPGHLEYYLSGANIERVTGQSPADVKDDELWSEFQDRLVAALNNVIVMWSPDVIVLGGSMIIRNEYLSFAYLQKALEERVKIFPEVPTLQRAQLQDKAGLVGARELLRQNIS